MKFLEILAALLVSSQKRFDDAKTELDMVKDAQAQYESEMKTEKDASYDEGVRDTLAKQGLPDDSKQFSLDELNAEVKAATDPLNAKLVDAQAKIDELSAPKEDSTPYNQQDVDKAVASAVEKVKAEGGLSAEQERVLGEELNAMASKLAPANAPA